MFHKILIANRGEIAVRVIRACREMGIASVAVYSTADRDALHVRMADESVCVGPPPASESYLYIPNIIAAAEITGADAIHPGYRFLSENSGFAEICKECNITFIGPTPEASRTAGNKVEARNLARKVKIPIVTGSDGTVSFNSKGATGTAGNLQVIVSTWIGGTRGDCYTITVRPSGTVASAYSTYTP